MSQRYKFRLSQKVCLVLDRGSIERVDTTIQNNLFYSTYFLIQNKESGFCLILDWKLSSFYHQEELLRSSGSGALAQGPKTHVGLGTDSTV